MHRPEEATAGHRTRIQAQRSSVSNRERMSLHALSAKFHPKTVHTATMSPMRVVTIPTTTGRQVQTSSSKKVAQERSPGTSFGFDWLINERQSLTV